MSETLVELLAFSIFFVLAIVLLVGFTVVLCSSIPYACSIPQVKQAIILLFKIMLVFLLGAMVYFIVAFILEYYARRRRSYVYLH